MWLSVAFLLIIAGLVAATAGVRWVRTRRAAQLLDPVTQRNQSVDLGDTAAVVAVAAVCGS